MLLVLPQDIESAQITHHVPDHRKHLESWGAVGELLDKLKERRSILLSIFASLQLRVGTAGAVGLLMLMIFLIGVGWAWWNWEDLEKRPGVSSIIEYIERRSLPAARGGHMTLAVAHLENDKGEEQEKVLLDELRGFEGTEIMRIGRAVIWPEADNEQTASAKAGEEARSLLQRTGADVLLWGSVITLGERRAMRLYWTTTPEFHDLKYTERYPAETLAIPPLFWNDLKQVLGLIAQTRMMALTEGRAGHYIADKLAPLIADVQKLLQSKEGIWDAETEARVRFAFARASASIGEGAGNTVLLRESVDNYHRLLTTWTRERVPRQWAETQMNLGNVLSILAEFEDEESARARLQEAAVAFSAALEEVTRERVPLLWAAARMDLGSALAALGEREGGENRTSQLQEAVAAFRDALKEWTRERVPFQWAAAKNNLAGALTTLCKWGSDEICIPQLQEAIAAFGDVLKEWTRERAPLLWATAQMNRGAALLRLGERERGESGIVRFQEAIAALRAALEEETRERVPHDWAMVKSNLGGALTTLCEWRNDEICIPQLQEAVAAFDDALDVFIAEGAMHNVKLTQGNRHRAIALLAARRREPVFHGCCPPVSSIRK
jgi:tetratricopeptide (TPR) repeat protein